MPASRLIVAFAVFFCLGRMAGAQTGICDHPQPLNPATGFDGLPAAQSIFDEDGPGPNPARLFVAGAFEHAGGVAAHNVARWDGSTWSALGSSPATSLIKSMRVFDDGHGPTLFLGGASGPQPILERWDGSHWTQFLLPPYFDRPVSSIDAMVVFDPDGPGPLPLCLHLAVTYGTTEGCTVVVLYRYDGSTFTQLAQAIGVETVTDLMPFDADGPGPAAPDLILSAFTGTTRDPCNNPGPILVRCRGGDLTLMAVGAVGEVYDALIVFDPDGSGPLLPRLYVGGRFDSIAGVTARGIASWDGSQWAAADAGLPADARALLTLTTFDADGDGPQSRVLAGFVERPNVVATSAGSLATFDGSSWSLIGPTITGNFSAYQHATLREFDPDGGGPGAPLLSLTGMFNGVGGQAAASWMTYQGGVISGPSADLGGPVETFAIFNDGAGRALFAAGEFSLAGAAPAANIARWDGTSWSALGSGIQPTAQVPAPAVHVLTVHNDGSGWALYAAGSFSAAGGKSASNIARWTGLGWERVGASGLGGEVFALEVHDPDGPGPLPTALYAGGSFATADGQPASHLAMWDGAAWSAVGGGVTGTVRALRSFDDGSGPALYVGGEVFSATGIAPNRAAKWTGSQWVALPPIGDGQVEAFGIHDEGAGFGLYVAGPMAWGGSALQRSIGRLVGNAWQPLAAPPPESVHTIRSVVDGDARVLYAGSSDPTRWLARYSGGVWTTVTPAFNAPVLAISPAFDDSHGPSVFIGGSFINVGGEPASHIARIPICSCYANCDGSTAAPVLNVADFICFQTRFAAGDPYANCDQSTAPPILNVADFICFQQHFAAGCP